MAQKRFAVSRRSGRKRVQYVLRSLTSGAVTEYNTMAQLAKALRDERDKLPQVDLLIDNDEQHAVQWCAGRAPARYARLTPEQLDKLCAILDA